MCSLPGFCASDEDGGGLWEIKAKDLSHASLKRKPKEKSYRTNVELHSQMYMHNSPEVACASAFAKGHMQGRYRSRLPISCWLILPHIPVGHLLTNPSPLYLSITCWVILPCILNSVKPGMRWTVSKYWLIKEWCPDATVIVSIVKHCHCKKLPCLSPQNIPMCPTMIIFSFPISNAMTSTVVFREVSNSSVTSSLKGRGPEVTQHCTWRKAARETLDSWVYLLSFSSCLSLFSKDGLLSLPN